MTKVTSEIMTRPGFDSDGLVIDKPDGAALLFMAPDRGAGPTMLQRLELATGRPVGPAAVVAPLHPGSSFVPLSAQTDVLPAADKVGLAFLEYNLNSTTDPLYVYAAAVPALGLAAFKPTQLPTPVSFANVSDVAVDKGRSFWTHFPAAGSHVVSAARVTVTGKGVNFTWLDGDGHLRGKASGSTALVPGETVEAAAGTLTGPPSLLIGSAVVAWLATSGNGTMELRAANVGCSK
jgi:hypothetical protein